MKVFCDLHIHSKYARACSKNLNLENLNYYSKFKGLDILTTGDITHPLWFKELYEKLEEFNYGVYKLKKQEDSVYFLLGGEISSIFYRNGKVKRIHYIVILPSFYLFGKLNKILSKYTNLSSDGRPTLGLDVIDFMKILFDIYENAIFIPAHIWTPWFSLYGSMSGFDSIYDAFGDYTKYVTAVETGLSSDIQMNWRIPELDHFSIISFSDAHSPQPHRLGREATCLEIEEVNYLNIFKALKNPDKKNRVLMTIEFFPEEGKYHYDGHRNCKIKFSPEESKKNNFICPVCNQQLTIGVLSRVEQLAKRPADYYDNNKPGFIKTPPLLEILSQIYNISSTSKLVLNKYFEIINKFGKEFDILLDNYDKNKMLLEYPEVYKALYKLKKGEILIEPGYDGEYGKIKINLEENKKESFDKIKKLF
jgi:uncharacterized protein (TIGR00375 family)